MKVTTRQSFFIFVIFLCTTMAIFWKDLKTFISEKNTLDFARSIADETSNGLKVSKTIFSDFKLSKSTVNTVPRISGISPGLVYPDSEDNTCTVCNNYILLDAEDISFIEDAVETIPTNWQIYIINAKNSQSPLCPRCTFIDESIQQSILKQHHR